MRLSISRINTFKACRRLYELKYIEGIEPDRRPQALETGVNYHELIEGLYRGELPFSDDSKAVAMAYAYNKYILPELDLVDIEKWVSYPLGGDNELVGRIDGMTRNGILVDHKTTSMSIEEFDYNLQWNEQSLAYMLATGARQMIFTVVKKPTIRQKKNESDEDFLNRMINWYDDKTEEKIAMLYIERSDEQVQKFEEGLQKMVAEMQYVINADNLCRNTTNCRKWGRMCEYAPICLEYDRNKEYFGFTKGDRSENSEIR